MERKVSMISTGRLNSQIPIIPQAIDPRVLQPIAPQFYATSPIPVGIKKTDMRRISPRPETAVSVTSGFSIDSEELDEPDQIIKKPAKKRHTRLFTDSEGRVIDVDFKDTDAEKTCPECQGECGRTGVAKSCCWVIWIALITVIVASIAGGVGYYYASQKIAPGQSCTTSSKCVENAVCTNLLCTCSPSYYVSSTICRSRVLVGQSCTSASQCVVNTYCNGTCQCLPAYYYDIGLGYCNLRGSYNSICSQDSQCLTTNSQCFTLTTSRCNCPSGTYYDKTTESCLTLKVQGQSCSDVSECISNSYCTSSVAGQCQCLASYYYQNGACLPRITIGYSCNTTSQCISNSQCTIATGATSTTCQCNTAYYLDTLTGTCQLLIQLDQACLYNAQCITNAECRVDYGMSYKQCKCISFYYSDLVPASCYPMKYINQACNADKQCITFASCRAASFGQPTTCLCNTGFWFNASTVAGGYGACLVLGLPGSNCYDASNCISNSICTVPSGATSAKCDCASNFYFSYTTSTCVSRQATGTSCTFDQQCLSNVCNLNTGVCT